MKHRLRIVDKQRTWTCFPLKVVILVSLGITCTQVCTAQQLGQSSERLTAVQPKKRIPWTTSRIQGSPDPPLPYRAELAFPKLQFKQPVTITNAPGTSRLFVVEVGGRVFSFPNEAGGDRLDLFADLKSAMPNLQQTYGMTFHPDYPSVPLVYVCCILRDVKEGSEITRFKVQPTDPPRVDPGSRQTILRWTAGGHNGCSLKFGPDGYLYISTGDGTGPNPPDTLRAGQDLSNLLSCILRIDVNHTDGNRNYSIPSDNPFIDVDGARPEIWAYGFRNPWKISFDRLTSDLWAGDVGWDTWELVFRVQRGGNYGWSIMEGSQAVHPTDQRGPTPILPPTTQHDHSEARSITGGFVYRGRRIPDLYGAYIYGDYSTGKIWALWFDGTQVTRRIELADTPFQIIAWGETEAGELYFMDYDRTNQIYRLVPNDSDGRSDRFPRRLSETGLFASVKQHKPAAGVIPYSVNATYWADGTRAMRLLALPGESKIRGDLKGQWQFPEGSVIARTVVTDSESSSAPAPSVPRRLETQILHLENQTWRPYSYIWNQAQDDAVLAPAEGTVLSWDGDPLLGAPEDFDAISARQHAGRGSSWRVASRTECKMCHTMKLDAVLGLNALQANVRFHDGQRQYSQLEQFYALGITDTRPSARLLNGKHLVNPYDESADLAQRARSYLHVNCVHCHRPGGGGTSTIHLDFTVPLEKTNTINQNPAQGDFRLASGKVVLPGDPFRSVLFYRLAKSGAGHMPHIGSTTTDERGLQLIHDWILACGAPDANVLPNPPATLSAALLAETANEELVSRIDDLLATSAGALRLVWHLRSADVGSDLRKTILSAAQRRTEPEVFDLFEPLLPASQRKQRLGPNFDPKTVLSLTGDVGRGRKIYWYTAGLQCQNCHRVHGHGGDLGPDLSQLGKKYAAPEMLKTIINPSEKIDPEYTAYTLITTNGQLHTGQLLQKNEIVVLKMADNTTTRTAVEEVAEFRPTRKSLMPEQLLQSLTAQEAADLLAYLTSLR